MMTDSRYEKLMEEYAMHQEDLIKVDEMMAELLKKRDQYREWKKIYDYEDPDWWSLEQTLHSVGRKWDLIRARMNKIDTLLEGLTPSYSGSR